MKNIYLLICLMFSFSLFALDCGQVQIDVTNAVYNAGLGLTYAEASEIGDAAYQSCLEHQQ